MTTDGTRAAPSREPAIDEPSLGELVRAAPARTALLGALPPLLAASQLANALYTGFPLWAAAAFAALMVATAAAVTRHHRAELRLFALERALGAERRD